MRDNHTTPQDVKNEEKQRKKLKPKS